MPSRRSKINHKANTCVCVGVFVCVCELVVLCVRVCVCVLMRVSRKGPLPIRWQMALCHPYTKGVFANSLANNPLSNFGNAPLPKMYFANLLAHGLASPVCKVHV